MGYRLTNISIYPIMHMSVLMQPLVLGKRLEEKTSPVEGEVFYFCFILFSQFKMRLLNNIQQSPMTPEMQKTKTAEP